MSAPCCTGSDSDPDIARPLNSRSRMRLKNCASAWTPISISLRGWTLHLCSTRRCSTCPPHPSQTVRDPTAGLPSTAREAEGRGYRTPSAACSLLRPSDDAVLGGTEHRAQSLDAQSDMQRRSTAMARLLEDGATLLRQTGDVSATHAITGLRCRRRISFMKTFSRPGHSCRRRLSFRLIALCPIVLLSPEIAAADDRTWLSVASRHLHYLRRPWPYAKASLRRPEAISSLIGWIVGLTWPSSVLKSCLLPFCWPIVSASSKGRQVPHLSESDRPGLTTGSVVFIEW